MSVSTDGKIPHKCPVCDGAGLVSRPPNIPGDQRSWDGSSAGFPYSCKACNGTGVVWGPPEREQCQS